MTSAHHPRSCTIPLPTAHGWIIGAGQRAEAAAPAAVWGFGCRDLLPRWGRIQADQFSPPSDAVRDPAAAAAAHITRGCRCVSLVREGLYGGRARLRKCPDTLTTLRWEGERSGYVGRAVKVKGVGVGAEVGSPGRGEAGKEGLLFHTHSMA